jgi:hypothetical protein
MVYGLWFLISVWCIFLVFYFAFGLSVSGVCFFLVGGIFEGIFVGKGGSLKFVLLE